MNNNQALLEYILNKFIPWLIFLVFLFLNIELTNIALYIIISAAVFIDRFSFKVGRSVGEYENNSTFRNDVDNKVDWDKKD